MDKKVEQVRIIIGTMHEYNEQCRALVGKDFALITVRRYESCTRYSYATSVCLANGVSIENVAKMLGHANIRMIQHYAKVLDSSILKDMMNVKSAIVNLE